ncbi:hypothetical protein HK098_004112 [Nowakowskiella sp. JEL0407]|nr:hypothetical protein HK098_004112 [Nowakowskiella sp. JEL0407]
MKQFKNCSNVTPDSSDFMEKWKKVLKMLDICSYHYKVGDDTLPFVCFDSESQSYFFNIHYFRQEFDNKEKKFGDLFQRLNAVKSVLWSMFTDIINILQVTLVTEVIKEVVKEVIVNVPAVPSPINTETEKANKVSPPEKISESGKESNDESATSETFFNFANDATLTDDKDKVDEARVDKIGQKRK